MKLRPKTLRVYPNPWGIAPAAIFEIEAAEKAKKENKDGHVPTLDPSRVTIDHRGVPCGVCPLDIYEHTPNAYPGMGVGAAVHPTKTVVTQELHPQDNLRSARQTTVWEFLGVDAEDTELPKLLAAKDPIEIPCTNYYVQRLQHGELIAADEKTAAAGGLKFEDPKALIPRLAEMAIKAWEQHFEGIDGGAFAFMAKERAPAVEAKAEQPPKKQPSQPRADGKGEADK